LERDFFKHLLFNKNVLKHEEQPLTTGPPPSCSLAGLGAALDPVRRGVTVSACTSQKKRISGQGAFSVMVMNNDAFLSIVSTLERYLGLRLCCAEEDPRSTAPLAIALRSLAKFVKLKRFSPIVR